MVDGLDQLAQVIGLLEKGVGADLARALPDVWCGADDNDDGVRPSSPDALDETVPAQERVSPLSNSAVKAYELSPPGLVWKFLSTK